MTIKIFFLFTGALFGGLFIFFPRLSIWLLLIMGMVVSGLVNYFFPAIGAVQWSVALISFALLTRSLLASLILAPDKKRNIPPFVVFAGLMLLLVILTTFLNRHYSETVIAAKNFFQYWSIPLALYFLVDDEKTVTGIMKALIVLAIFQTPIAIVQRLFFAGNFPGDSVTGTFGGSMMGGGPNAALSIFLTIMIAVVLSLAMKRVLPMLPAILLCFWFVLPVLLTNARAIIIFFLVMFFIIFRRNMIKNPSLIIIGGPLICVMTVGIFFYHYSHAWQYTYSHKQPKNVEQYLSRVISGTLGFESYYEKEKLNRMTAVTYWGQEHRRYYPVLKTLFGHGLGSTKEFGIIKGHMTQKPRHREKRIGYTALSTLLWDVGLAGSICYLLIIISAFFTAAKLEKNPGLPDMHQGVMAGAKIACLFILMSLPYKVSFLTIQAFNLFGMFVIGYITFWYKKVGPT